jgi:hypothetical protein
MNTDLTQKTYAEQAQQKLAETAETIKDKVQYAGQQAQDRTKAQYYETKADINEQKQNVKNKLNE